MVRIPPLAVLGEPEAVDRAAPALQMDEIPVIPLLAGPPVPREGAQIVGADAEDAVAVGDPADEAVGVRRRAVNIDLVTVDFIGGAQPALAGALYQVVVNPGLFGLAAVETQRRAPRAVAIQNL